MFQLKYQQIGRSSEDGRRVFDTKMLSKFRSMDPDQFMKNEMRTVYSMHCSYGGLIECPLCPARVDGLGLRLFSTFSSLGSGF